MAIFNNSNKTQHVQVYVVSNNNKQLRESPGDQKVRDGVCRTLTWCSPPLLDYSKCNNYTVTTKQTNTKQNKTTNIETRMKTFLLLLQKKATRLYHMNITR